MRSGTLAYAEGLALQEQLLERRQHEEYDILVLMEHFPVVTLGHRSSVENLLLPAEEFDRRGIERVTVPRGGDVTFHGPGQLVGYPIVDLRPLGRDVRGFLRQLEEVLIDLLRSFDIDGHRIDGKTGVWVNGEKIASIGIGVRRWISWHGFALNVGVDLDYFSMINPCGLRGISMTSMEKTLGSKVSMAQVKQQMVQSFERVFQIQNAGEYEFFIAKQA